MKQFKHKSYSLGFTMKTKNLSEALLRHVCMKDKGKGGKKIKGGY